MPTQWLKTALIALALIALAGCAGVISKPVAQQANPEAELSAVLKTPDAFLGEMVLWSGRIISTKPLEEGTLIEVLQISSDRNRRPPQSDKTEGRFLALNPGFLDPLVYKADREITLAGRIREMRTQPLGEIQYSYPLVDVVELHIWPQRPGELHLRDDDRPSHWPYHHWGCPGYWCW